MAPNATNPAVRLRISPRSGDQPTSRTAGSRSARYRPPAASPSPAPALHPNSSIPTKIGANDTVATTSMRSTCRPSIVIATDAITIIPVRSATERALR